MADQISCRTERRNIIIKRWLVTNFLPLTVSSPTGRWNQQIGVIARNCFLIYRCLLVGVEKLSLTVTIFWAILWSTVNDSNTGLNWVSFIIAPTHIAAVDDYINAKHESTFNNWHELPTLCRSSAFGLVGTFCAPISEHTILIFGQFPR